MFFSSSLELNGKLNSFNMNSAVSTHNQSHTKHRNVTLPHCLLVPPTRNLAMACGPSWMLMPLARFRLGLDLGGALSESSEELRSSKCPDLNNKILLYTIYLWKLYSLYSEQLNLKNTHGV